MTAPTGVSLPGASPFTTPPPPSAPPAPPAAPQHPYQQAPHQPAPHQQAPHQPGQHQPAPHQQHQPGQHQPAPHQAGPYQQPTAGLVTCPICRTPQTGRYCEECGYDFDLSAPSQRQSRPTEPAGYGYPPPAPFPPPAAPAPPAGYGYPPPQAFPQTAGFPESDGLDQTGPVYAQPERPGDQSPTSFRLAPPSAAPQQPPAAMAQPPQPPARSTWMAVVSADRDYFTDMMARSGPEAAGLFFPPYCPERRIPLTGRGQLRIGRRSQHRGTVPEIDLSVPPEDPGASHQHAMLAEQADGSWVLVDQDSTNGTTVNGSPDPVPPHTAIPLADGDRIHIGAWTTITLHRS
ncbi:FHA domain-containing protein [Kitasatospora sp. MMS16-BH015]|uniref:FHA domain-containing protein n=1 Tax=Kitasatospora sp. MMS16-BH015 TaxID=2018025 RepID=UPI0020C26195|nr:FHA domain-containing protein [Kitasatospora sp. MMS16-BH015]